MEKQRDINLDHDWWDLTYEDARNVGLEIESFDDFYQSMITGKFIDGPLETIELILKHHGKKCDTYMLAAEYKPRFIADSIARHCIEDPDWEWPSEELTAEFRKALLSLYLKMLQEEYIYLQTDEAVIETIQAGEYKFDEEGDII